MKNSQIIKTTGVIATICGALTSIVGWHKLSEANGVLKTLRGSTHGTYGKTIEIWQSQKSISIVILIIGIVITLTGLIMIYNGFLKANAVTNPENDNQTSKVNTIDNITRVDIEDRLAQLDSLKSSGIITDEEYNEKRKKIIDEL